jgi:hypothetical protein
MPTAMMQPDHRSPESENGRQMNSSYPVLDISQRWGAATAIELGLLATTSRRCLSRKVIEEEIACRL